MINTKGHLPKLSSYHTNLKIEGDSDVSSTFRLSGQVKKVDGSPTEYPPGRYHPTDKKNLYIYKDAPSDGKTPPDEEYAVFYGQDANESEFGIPY